jgi:predicted metal-dependent phosphoesterase TrpH
VVKTLTDKIIKEEKPSFDFHIHSKFSYDSLLSPRKIVEVAKKKGLAGIAITDHNTIKGGEAAKKYQKKSFLVIVGSEIRTNKGDIIGLFLDEEIENVDFYEVIDSIREQDGLVVLPHPYKSPKKDIYEIARRVDVIETKNGRIPPHMNDLAVKLASELQKPIIGGSDAHTSSEIGRIKTIFSEMNNEEDLRKALFKGECEIVGRESPRWVHYISTIIGRTKTRDLRGLFPQVKASLGERRRV